MSDSWSFPALASETFVVPVRGTYDRGARAVVRQSLPLPLTVLSVGREVDVGRR